MTRTIDVEALAKHCSQYEPFNKVHAIQASGRRWLVATDTHYIVAIESDGAANLGVAFFDRGREKIVQDYLHLGDSQAADAIDIDKLKAWLGRPKWEHEQICTDCNGHVPVCEECGGEGEVRCTCQGCRDQHMRECSKCDGRGKGCKACGSSGKIVIRYEARPGYVEGICVDRNVLARALDGLIGPAEFVHPIGAEAPLAIIGPGWRVIMMPMRPSPGEVITSFS